MITDCYDISTEPMMTLKDFYGEPQHLVDICLIIFSIEIHNHLLHTYECEQIAVLRSCNGNTPVYKLNYKGIEVAFYLTAIGSAMASGLCHDTSWVTGATKFIMFGSCGSLDREQTEGKFIIPTESYRGEGCSYYYAPPADYITIRSSAKLSAQGRRALSSTIILVACWTISYASAAVDAWVQRWLAFSRAAAMRSLAV